MFDFSEFLLDFWAGVTERWRVAFQKWWDAWVSNFRDLFSIENLPFPAIALLQFNLRGLAATEALITDYREVNPNIARGLDRATTFLSLVSLIALIVGAIGVGTSMHAHLQQKMESIAIMKDCNVWID